MNGHDRDAEARLVRLAQELGRREGSYVSAQRVASTVLARLRAQHAKRSWWSMRRLAPLAAAASVVLAIGLVVRGLTHRSGANEVPVPVELADLPEAALQEVLDSLALDAPASELVTVVLGELSETELNALLEAMEG